MREKLTAIITEKWTFLWLLLFLVAPFANGFNDKIPLGLCLFCIGIFFLFFVKEIHVDLVSLPLLGLTIWTGLGFIYGTNYYEILFATAAYLLCLLFYWIVKAFFLQNTEEREKHYLFTLYLFGLILAAVNYFDYFSYFSIIPNYRFQSGIEYSNALAMALCLALFVGIWLLKTCHTKKVLIHLGNLFLLFAFLFTYSRMMWVIGGFFLGIWAVYLWRDSFTKKKWLFCLGSIFLGLCLLFVCDMLFSWGLAQRLTSISLSSTELNERFAYYRDSLVILKDSPLWGLGAGGWQSRLFEYQSGVYICRYPHSFLAQSAVDGGIPAVLCTVILVTYPMIKAVKCVKKNPLAAFCFLANLTMICHGFLDFDFQFPILFMIFLANQCILLTFAKAKTKPLKKPGKIITKALVILMLPIILYLTVIEITFEKGNESYKWGAYKNAVATFRTVDSLAPYHSRMAYLKAQSLTVLNTKANQKDIEAAIAKAKATDAKNPKYSALEGQIYDDLGDFERSADAWEETIIYQPILLKNYQNYRNVLITLVSEAQNNGDTATANRAETRLAEIPRYINEAESQYSFWTFRLNHKPELDQYPKEVQ